VRFARTGNPNGGPKAGRAPHWPAVTTVPTAYLAVGATTRAERLAPVRERAKATAMAASVQKWAKTEQP